ncbi:MAG: response regulator [Bauldia sp.]
MESLRASILLVEDDEPIRLVLSRVLSKAGYDVAQAADGREAIKRIAESLPDLIISDVVMPRLDGFGLVAMLRADPSTRMVPLILLSARNKHSDIVRGLDLGADDYLVKPFDGAELLARVRAKMVRPPVPFDLVPQDATAGILPVAHFNQEAAREIARTQRGGAPGVLAYVALNELSSGLRERMGTRSQTQLAAQVSALVDADRQPLDLLSRDSALRFPLLMPEMDVTTAKVRLAKLAYRIAAHSFVAGGERMRLTPTIGYTTFDDTTEASPAREALTALDVAATHLDLQPIRYHPSQNIAVSRKKAALEVALRPLLERLGALLLPPLQLAVLAFLAFGLPLTVYSSLARVGWDITPFAYLVVLLALLFTAGLIWAEGIAAMRRVDPPNDPQMVYPPASAIIAAYLPNEAATVTETIEAFLHLEYPGPLQIILAYNTPRTLPVEAHLRELAARDPRFVPIRVADSTSKAQNVNAALAAVTGEFVGVFDADHHPDARSFTRAARWLANGYDVVQGHCQVRNGDESWVSRMVAVEFESIYAASHPGRARLHDFGVFGGSNGYWKTNLLRETRMHGFMLTEDIDSSMRVVEAGYKIASDPHLVSRELATTTLKALWNQRLRWAQGWFQVSLRHTASGFQSSRLSLRQKLGFAHLLAWREIYPWISLQMVPILAFWAWRAGGIQYIDWFVPIFVLTTIVTQSVAVGQVYMAYVLAAPEIRKRTSWFVSYFFISFFFYTPLKNLIAMYAQIKELFRDRKWKVTPRGARGGGSAPAEVEAVQG